MTTFHNQSAAEALTLAAQQRFEQVSVRTEDLKVNSGEIVASSPLRFSEDASIISLSSPAGHQLLQLLRLHRESLDRVSPATLANVVNETLASEIARARLPERVTFCFGTNGSAVGLVSGRRQGLSMQAFVEVVSEAANSAGVDLAEGEVWRSRIGEGVLDLKISFRRFAALIADDATFFGIRLCHSVLGDRPTEVCIHAERQWCANGATSPIHLEGVRARLPRRGPESQTQMVARLKAVCLGAFTSLHGRAQALVALATSNKRIDLRHSIREVAARQRFSRWVLAELLAGIEAGDHFGHQNVYGLIQVLTRLGTHGPRNSENRVPASIRQRLQLIGGVYSSQPVHFCRECHQIIEPSRRRPRTTPPSAN
jgi:hypothetical protein